MKKINEWFVCHHCGKDVPPAQQTCRNHCPWCFVSQHVDLEIPGDRATECGGKMVPESYLIANGEIKIRFVCLNCGAEHHNKASRDDEVGELDEVIRSWKGEIEKIWTTL